MEKRFYFTPKNTELFKQVSEPRKWQNKSTKKSHFTESLFIIHSLGRDFRFDFNCLCSESNA